jgi:hypothetical protein
LVDRYEYRPMHDVCRGIDGSHVMDPVQCTSVILRIHGTKEGNATLPLQT